MAAPVLIYSYFSHGELGPDGTPRTKVLTSLPTDSIGVSFRPYFNQLVLKYTPDMQIVYYEVRITKADEDFGIGIGTLWGETKGPGIPGGELQTVTLDVNSTYFPTVEGVAPDGSYRIGLYAKGVNGLWDVTYILLSSDDLIVAPNDYTGIEVVADDPTPSA